MGRGVSSGGGQSSLGYLFGDGGGEPPKTGAPKGQAPSNEGKTVPKPVTQASSNVGKTVPKPVAQAPSNEGKTVSKPVAASPPAEGSKQIPAGIHSSSSNNYLRADGQNTGNFITDRPSTKVHAAPGGGSSLDYLFGGAGRK